MTRKTGPLHDQRNRNASLSHALKRWLAILLGAFCVGSIVCLGLRFQPALSSNLDNLVYDQWLTSGEKAAPDTETAVVIIDEPSLKRLGQLPWPRPLLADLIEMLLLNGVKAIGLDIWLSEADRSSPIVVDSLLEKHFDLNLDLSKIPPLAQDNDRYFRNAIAGKPVLPGTYVAFHTKKQLPDNMPDGVKLKEGQSQSAHSLTESVAQATEFIPPLPIFSNMAPVGVLSAYTDADGLVRKIPMLTRVGDRLYAGLALQTIMAARGIDSIELKGSNGVLEEIGLGEKLIPVEKDGSFRPVYTGPRGTVPTYSALDVLDGNIGPKELKDKIIFLGSSAHSYGNLRSTPFDPEVPDPEIHATVATNILSGQSIMPPKHEEAILMGATYFSAILGVAAFSALSLPVYVLVGIGALALYIGGSWALFQAGVFLPPAGPVLALLLAGILIIPFRYWREQAERNKLRQAFGRYVSPQVVSRIISSGDELLKGEQKEVSVMFTDVRGFTTIAEQLEPHQLVRLLNCYFTPMTACVAAHGGTLDKFIGDALMAFWNAPLNINDHALEAVQAAFDMQKALARLRPSIETEFGVCMRMGIGINSGLVHVGNMGSNDLLDYTCIGDTVNLASRLEGMCKRYGMDIVVSDRVKNACQESINFLLLDQISVKGRVKPIKIYSPLYPEEEYDSVKLEQWQTALNLYFSGNFMEAEKMFAGLQSDNFLHAACMLFMERCLMLAHKSPANWDGTWIYKEK